MRKTCGARFWRQEVLTHTCPWLRGVAFWCMLSVSSSSVKWISLVSRVQRKDNFFLLQSPFRKQKLSGMLKKTQPPSERSQEAFSALLCWQPIQLLACCSVSTIFFGWGHCKSLEFLNLKTSKLFPVSGTPQLQESTVAMPLEMIACCSIETDKTVLASFACPCSNPQRRKSLQSTD